MSELIRKKTRILGLDVGDKIIGISISDERIKIATGLKSIKRTGIDKYFIAIAEYVKLYNIALIIFGWPLQTNGLPGEQCQKTTNFIEKLSEHCNVDFVAWDERFSTKIVNNLMIEANMSRKKRKSAIDQGSAVYILQGALDFLNFHSI
jgi:putative Holliday junction resolvase